MLVDELMRAATRMGLVVKRGRATGRIDGQRISVWATFGGSNSQVVNVRGELETPLDLGVHMSRHAIHPFGEARVTTGYADIDGELTVVGDEPDRTRSLFEGELADAIVALYGASFELGLDDEGCLVYQVVGFDVPDAVWLERAVHGAARLARLMDAARARIAPATPIREHASAIRGLAKARNLAFSTTPVRASGEFDRCAIEVGGTRTAAREYHLFARARFETALGLGLIVRRQRFFDGVRAILGGQHLEFGDAPFDHRFLVRSTRPERIPAILDVRARALLRSLDEHFGAVAVDDQGITVDPIPLSIQLDSVAIVAEMITEGAMLIVENLRSRGESGPYR